MAGCKSYTIDRTTSEFTVDSATYGGSSICWRDTAPVDSARGYIVLMAGMLCCCVDVDVVGIGCHIIHILLGNNRSLHQ